MLEKLSATLLFKFVLTAGWTKRTKTDRTKKNRAFRHGKSAIAICYFKFVRSQRGGYCFSEIFLSLRGLSHTTKTLITKRLSH